MSGGRGEGRQQYEELPKEGDGQKEKMDGTRDKNTMIIVCMCDGLILIQLLLLLLVNPIIRTPLWLIGCAELLHSCFAI